MEKQGSRALLAAVIGMGVLLFIGSLVLVGVLVHRMMHPRPAVQSDAQVAALPARPMEGGIQAPLLLDEAPGTHVASVTAQSDGLLAIGLSGGEVADRIVIWDPAGQRIVARLVIGHP
ncbi:hypothetical protein D3W54_03910 [Komagataeibacter medellinensis]|uniref:Uncharacterized protein n=1 Tax=Komagataeibacter medellinensis TaxID=1177712 RepID=A0ABQ6VTH2_9PROT|nr:hypothetical protein [Komagataeibacter medellinensis]KAB8123491.1 hypothetical protein D3W54_03910 [Komagataeibacter medellinensis]